MSWAKGDVCPSLLSPAFASPSVLIHDQTNQEAAQGEFIWVFACETVERITALKPLYQGIFMRKTILRKENKTTKKRVSRKKDFLWF